MGSDGAEDITVMINLSPGKFGGSQYGNSFLPSFGSGVLCAKASMLLQVHILRGWIMEKSLSSVSVFL